MFDPSKPTEGEPLAAPAAPEAAKDNAAPPAAKKVIIAIHGIGAQIRGSFAKSVAAQFARCYQAKDKVPHATQLPAGWWDGAVGADQPPLQSIPGAPTNLSGLSFSEVWWADLTQELDREGNRLEKTKLWARSVVDRAQGRYAQSDQSGVVDTRPYDLAAMAVEEIHETVHVLENLLAILGKLGIFDFKLSGMLDEYLGDVQQMGDFAGQRKKVLKRFKDAVTHIANESTGDIYFVTHSEGTVVGFLGLLDAICDGGERPAWLDRVRGFFTYGSPIDKHLHLWPHIFEKYQTVTHAATKPILWLNYYDYGDPVGFELEGARDWIKWKGLKEWFNFEPHHDLGFARYLLPGKAHNDYFEDDEMFAHTIKHGIDGEALLEKKSMDLMWAKFVSPVIPYLLSFVVIVAGCFILYRTLPESVVGGHVALAALASGILIMGTTVFARSWRMTPSVTVRAGTLLGWVAACAGYAAIMLLAVLPDSTSEKKALWVSGNVGFSALLVALCGLVDNGIPKFRKRPVWGLRLMMIMGATLVLILVLITPGVLKEDPDMSGLQKVLGFAAFLYCWWLGTLLYDLSFQWHRYIRQSLANKILFKCSREYRSKTIKEQ